LPEVKQIINCKYYFAYTTECVSFRQMGQWHAIHQTMWQY